MLPRRLVLILAGAVVAFMAGLPAVAQSVERLYILNCGEGVAGDISRWSPGVNVGKSMAFVDSCYLIRHRQGWLLWDTGLSDAIAAMPDGLHPADARGIVWRRPTTLIAELSKLGLKPDDIRYVAVSHSHPDHIGNVALFPHSMLLVQKAEYQWPGPDGPRFKPGPPVTELEGDRDVFGDGSVVIKFTPGHTAGHSVLFLKLAKTGPLVLSGDLYHYPEELKVPRVPTGDVNKDQTLASRAALQEFLKKTGAQLWIQHDLAAIQKLRKAPAFYE